MTARLTSATGYAIVDARSRRHGGRYVDRAWLTRSEAAAELASLLRYHAGSEWASRLSVQPTMMSVSDWERCARETERSQRRHIAIDVGGTGKPGLSRVERRKVAA